MTKFAWARYAFLSVVSTLVAVGTYQAADEKPIKPAVPGQPKISNETGSHEPTSHIAMTSEDGKMRLQTMTVDGEGRVLGLVAQPRAFGGPAKDIHSEIHVYSPEGKKVGTWKVDFHAHSINVSPNGEVYVAGNGKLARFDKDGKELSKTELPHIAALLKDDGEIRKKAEAQIKTQKENFEKNRDNLKKQKEAIEAKKEEDRTDAEKRQLTQLTAILKSYEQTAKYYENMTVDSVVAQMTSRVRIINGIAIGEKDVFVACGETKGFGYAIWRMTHKLENPVQVLGSIGGCCGQMDIQVSGTDFLLAENTKHSFARYDRDGKPKSRVGKKGTTSDGDCFGGCCNPMNIKCAAKAGDIYTAESEGVIKRYDADGKFLGMVAAAKLTGGCKNVAIAVSPDASKVYLCDQPGSRVIVLEKKK